MKRKAKDSTKTPRRICFVTGTRAEFGLMLPVLRAIQESPKLSLQLVVTGIHLQKWHGHSIDQIRRDGWRIDAVVPWKPSESPSRLSEQTGMAVAGLSRAFERLKSDVVLVVGDRVEAFAAATAGHVSQRIVAHVHGGDRAMGQVDDALRHATTKLAHVHFPATKLSAVRIARLGEQGWRIHIVGAPGIDGIKSIAAKTGLPRHRFALLVLHPIEPDDQKEYARAREVLRATSAIRFDRIVIVHPNNDPGHAGISRCWNKHAKGGRFDVHRNVDRPTFLGMMRDAAVIVGNSSSGIIEAASFGTPAIDIGPRQQGRDQSENVTNVPYRQEPLRRALSRIWNNGHPKRYSGANSYGGQGAGRRIARILETMKIDNPLLRKLIGY